MSAGPVKIDRDDAVTLTGLVGFVAMLVGLWLIFPPAALVVGGGLMVLGALRAL